MQLLDILADNKRSMVFVLAGLMIMALAGCNGDAKPAGEPSETQSPARPVRVIVVGDATFADVLQRQWSARTESELELRQMSIEQLEEVKQLSADIIIYPAACLGTLAHRKLIAPPSTSAAESSEQVQTDVFDLQQNAEVRWGDQTYAFSFGSPQLVLMYRADLFAKQGLEPPETWEQYQLLVEQLDRTALGDSAPPEGQPWTPICEPLASGWAGNTLLARAASYASHPSQFSVLFDYATMEPLIAGPPFVRALEELVTAAKSNPADSDQLTPETARRRILAGETAMAFSWPSHTTADGEPLKIATGVEISFAELPGATTAYHFGEQQWTPHADAAPARVPLIGVAGLLGSVTANARRARDAAEVLALLTSQEWSVRLSPSSTATTMFRHSHLTAPQLWTDHVLPPEASTSYAEVVAITQTRPLHLTSLRIPGWQRYQQALDQAVVAACSGDKSPQDALNETASAWSALTAEIGLDSQRAAYTRCLGLEP